MCVCVYDPLLGVIILYFAVFMCLSNWGSFCSQFFVSYLKKSRYYCFHCLFVFFCFCLCICLCLCLYVCLSGCVFCFCFYICFCYCFFSSFFFSLSLVWTCHSNSKQWIPNIFGANYSCKIYPKLIITHTQIKGISNAYTSCTLECTCMSNVYASCTLECTCIIVFVIPGFDSHFASISVLFSQYYL